MKQGLVSIIVPVYNVEKYLTKCIDSIINQTYRNIEVIIINDGSTDKSGEILKKYVPFPNIKIFNKENEGLSSARNLGIQYASGEYIVFIDSDDWIKKDFIEKYINAFEDGVDIVIGGYVLKTTTNTFVKKMIEKPMVFFDKLKEQEILLKHLVSYGGRNFLIKESIMPVWKNMYRKSLIEKNRLSFISERMVMAEDYVFNLQAYYYALAVKVIPYSGYFHVVVYNSLSKKYRENAFEMSNNRIRKCVKFINQMNVSNKKALLIGARENYVFSVANDVNKLIFSKEKKKIRRINNQLNNQVYQKYKTKQFVYLQGLHKQCAKAMVLNNAFLIYLLFVPTIIIKKVMNIHS